MECKCAEMTLLSEKMNKLTEIKSKSASFNANISSSKTDQEYLENDSWSATESTSLKGDIEDKLPNMTDKIEESHEELLNEIEEAMLEMNEAHKKLKEMDDAFHEQNG